MHEAAAGGEGRELERGLGLSLPAHDIGRGEAQPVEAALESLRIDERELSGRRVPALGQRHEAVAAGARDLERP